MAIIANELRIGNVIEHKNGIWRVVATEHVKPGKGGAFMQTELKNLKTGTKLNERFRSDETIDRLMFEVIPATFLYRDGNTLEIMNNSTFEQISLDIAIVGEQLPLLQDNMDISLEMAGDEVIAITFPETLIFTVIDTEPYIKGQTVSNPFKPAKLDNGLTISVPPFVEVDEKIVLRTSDLTYLKRA